MPTSTPEAVLSPGERTIRFVAGIQAVALALMAAGLVAASVAAGRATTEFHGLAQTLSAVAAAIVAFFALLIGASAWRFGRSASATWLLAVSEIPVIGVSLWATTAPGIGGHLVGPAMAVASAAVLCALMVTSNRAVGAVAGTATVVAVLAGIAGLVQPAAPTFGRPPPLDASAPIVFDDIVGCQHEVILAPKAHAVALECDPAGASTERYRMSTAYGPGQVHVCGLHINGPRPPARACIEEPNGVLVSVKGPSDYYFRQGAMSPDGRWVAFSDTKNRLLVASSDGRGPWLLPGHPAVVTRWR